MSKSQTFIGWAQTRLNQYVQSVVNITQHFTTIKAVHFTVKVVASVYGRPPPLSVRRPEKRLLCESSAAGLHDSS